MAADDHTRPELTQAAMEHYSMAAFEDVSVLGLTLRKLQKLDSIGIACWRRAG